MSSQIPESLMEFPPPGQGDAADRSDGMDVGGPGGGGVAAGGAVAGGGAAPVAAAVDPDNPPWKPIFPHLPLHDVQRNFKLVSAPEGLPPGTYTYFVSRGQTMKLALKKFEYDKAMDDSYNFDHKGKAMIKVHYPHSIEVTPEVAIKTIRVWSEMLTREGYDLDDPNVK